jgi:outer membrane protein TolC
LIQAPPPHWNWPSRKSLVAAQQWQLPRVQQQAQDALISLAALLGRPVQQLSATGPSITCNGQISPPAPQRVAHPASGHRTRRSKLAAAEADVVARAAMLPALTLTAQLGSGANQFDDLIRSPSTT